MLLGSVAPSLWEVEITATLPPQSRQSRVHQRGYLRSRQPKTPHSFVSCPAPAALVSKKSIVSTRSVSAQLRRQYTHRPPGNCTSHPSPVGRTAALIVPLPYLLLATTTPPGYGAGADSPPVHGAAKRAQLPTTTALAMAIRTELMHEMLLPPIY